MKKILALLLVMLLAGCDQTPPTETVESLLSHPERLKALREQCRQDRARTGDELCNRVAEATSRRFLGDGKVPYAPPKDKPTF